MRVALAGTRSNGGETDDGVAGAGLPAASSRLTSLVDGERLTVWFGFLAALLAMLNSCAPGVSVVNIDNGYGAAHQASQINHLAVKI